ncbi:hypothetical protein K0U83_17675 [bacterium]|nr:hypothetical protein [bacterium]
MTSKEAFEADFIVSDGNTSCVKCAEHNAAQAVTPDYCWAITRDLLDGTEKGVRGPGGCHMTVEEIKDHPNTEHFRMKDGDGEVYYEGYIVQLNEEGRYAVELAPLDDFGQPNAGCASIEYRIGGQWVEV